MLVTMRRAGLNVVNNNTDEVLCAFPMPPGSRLVNVWLNFDCSVTATLGVEKVVAYALRGFILPVLDPDAASTWESIWDTLVPKDETQASGAIDLDTGTADDTPEWTPGAPDLTALMDLKTSVELYRRRTWLSASTHPRFIHLDTTVKYLPGDAVKSRIKGARRTDVFAGAVFAFSSPGTTLTETTVVLAPTKQQWGMLMFLEATLVRMMVELFTIFEAGAESPYEEASDFIAELTEPLVNEVSGRAGDFSAVTWAVNYQVTAQVVMPEHGEFSNLSSEGAR